jgi:hypothetical protein
MDDLDSRFDIYTRRLKGSDSHQRRHSVRDHTSCTGMESVTGFQLLFGSNDCHRIYEFAAIDQSFDR